MIGIAIGIVTGIVTGIAIDIVIGIGIDIVTGTGVGLFYGRNKDTKWGSLGLPMGKHLHSQLIVSSVV